MAEMGKVFLLFMLLFLLTMLSSGDQLRPLLMSEDEEQELSGDGEFSSAFAETLTTTDNPEEDDGLGIVEKFLSLVETYARNKDNCTAGVSFKLGDGIVNQYGVLRYKRQALLAVTRANYLTRLWKGMPESEMTNTYFLYTQVRSLVEVDPYVFAAGNCYDGYQFKNISLYCPYAFRLPNDSSQIMVKDLAVEYKYLDQDSEFFYQARLKAAEKLKGNYTETIGFAMYRYNDTAHLPVVREDSITIRYEDGHWSKPYFDCKGGDIWMMTYTVPFFGYNHQTKQYFFKGTSGIDIDLQNVDIDQCPEVEGKNENVFAGSAKCKNTTKCEPVPGIGFRRGSYKCVCEEGYYFPNTELPMTLRYYNGSEIEEEFEKRKKGLSSRYDDWFECLPCAQGCQSCEDAQPCIITLDWVMRSVVLGLSCLIMCFIPCLAWFTYMYRDVKVLKAASPMLMLMVLIGALFLYCPMIVQYFEPTELTCCLRMWLRELGFSTSYGALLLKTWRISVVFRVRSAQRVKISDTDLIKRLLLIILLFTAYLTVRTVIGRPRVDKGTHVSGLYAFQCSWDVWDYCAAIAELCLLLWGIRLCIVVRKAPSEFNESRFISWAIYNETLLSLFLNITMFFLQSPANPDLLYLVLFIHTQLTTTVTLGFLFGSKAYLVYKYRGKEQPATTMSRGSKYMAAPKNAPAVLNTMTSAGNSSTVGERISEEGEYNNSCMEKEIQEEFRRLYLQLELLKQRNMKLGNPHLTHKLSAMTEAAKKEEPPDSIPGSPNLNGKKVMINLDEFSDATRV